MLLQKYLILFTDEDNVVVGGQIDIDGEEYIIERKLNRKLSKSGEL